MIASESPRASAAPIVSKLHPGPRRVGRKVTVQPSKGWAPLNLRELWEFREFLYFMVWRDLKVRYKQTIMGVSWAVIQPLAMTLIFTFVFGELASVPTGGVPYPIFAFAGLVPWGLFARGLSDGGTSVSKNAAIVGKVYFPRLLLPFASVLSALVDLALSLPILAAFMVYYGMPLTWALLTLPLFVALAVVAALAASCLLSPIEVRYRDIRYIVPFVSQFWLLATPIAYPLSIVPTEWLWLYSLNPMVGIVEGFRWAVSGGTFNLDTPTSLSLLIMCSLFVGSLFYFRRREKEFADVI